MVVCNAGSWGFSPGPQNKVIKFLVFQYHGVLAKIVIYSGAMLLESLV